LLQSSKTPKDTHIPTTKMGIHFGFHFGSVGDSFFHSPTLILFISPFPLSYVKAGVKTCRQCVMTPKVTNYLQNKFVSIKYVDNMLWHQKLQIMWRTNSLVQWLCLKKHWSSNKPLFYVMGSKGHRLYNKKFLRVRCVHLVQTLLSYITCMVNQSRSHLLFSNALITSISLILNIRSWNGVGCW
jgi:hypothetical protein